MKKTKKYKKQKMLQQRIMGLISVLLGVLIIVIANGEDATGCIFPFFFGIILLTSKDVVIN